MVLGVWPIDIHTLIIAVGLIASTQDEFQKNIGTS
jgi:hypothetical protein